MASDSWVEPGNNLWIGQRSSNKTFEDIVQVIGGRYAIVNKKFADGGFCWILCNDKEKKKALREELMGMDGWTLNFGRESNDYFPAKSGSAYQRIPQYDPQGKEYTVQQWQSYYEEQKVFWLYWQYFEIFICFFYYFDFIWICIGIEI